MFLEFEWGGVSTRFTISHTNTNSQLFYFCHLYGVVYLLAAAAAGTADGWFAKSGILG